MLSLTKVGCRRTLNGKVPSFGVKAPNEMSIIQPRLFNTNDFNTRINYTAHFFKHCTFFFLVIARDSLLSDLVDLGTSKIEQCSVRKSR